jgi:hypothetical protein
MPHNSASKPAARTLPAVKCEPAGRAWAKGWLQHSSAQPQPCHAHAAARAAASIAVHAAPGNGTALLLHGSSATLQIETPWKAGHTQCCTQCCHVSIVPDAHCSSHVCAAPAPASPQERMVLLLPHGSSQKQVWQQGKEQRHRWQHAAHAAPDLNSLTLTRLAELSYNTNLR